MATKKPVVVSGDEPNTLPESVTLAAPYAYFEDDGETAHYWAANQTVTDKGEIRELFARGARLIGYGAD